MQWQLVVFSMLPVVVFALALRIATLRDAAAAAAATAALELACNAAAFGRVDPFSAASFALFGALGPVGWWRDDPRVVKLQPALLELLLAAVFLYFSAVHGTPLFAVIVDEYLGLLDWLAPWRRGYFEEYALTLSRSIPFLLLAHAGLTAWAAWRLSTAWWVAIRIPGFYATLALLFIGERLLGVSV